MLQEKRRLLLVEDDEGVAQGIGRVLERHRPVRIAYSVAEARAALASGEEFAGAVIDYGLPDGNGLEIADEIRRRTPLLPLLMLTGTHDAEVITRCYAMDIPYREKGASWDNSKFLAEVDEHERAAVEGPPSKADRVFAATVAGRGLTNRKCVVARQRLRHGARAEAAKALGVTENTLKAHMSAILPRLGAPSVAALAHRILRESLSEPTEPPTRKRKK